MLLEGTIKELKEELKIIKGCYKYIQWNNSIEVAYNEWGVKDKAVISKYYMMKLHMECKINIFLCP